MRVLELHAPIKMVRRSQGHSSTAAAAYRSASRIKDERTGEIHDYTKRQDSVEFEAVLFPLDTPEHIEDRNQLWNATELHEKRKDAAVARDLEVSLPHEFSAEQRREAGFQIANLLVDRMDVAVDVCWHKPNDRQNQHNYHIHILFPNRRFENGEWAKKKDLPLEFGRTKESKGQAQEEVKRLRKNIADTLNNIAVRDGLDVYVEHKSFEDRGIDQEPTMHLGKYAAQLEKAGIQTQNGNHNRAIKERNAAVFEQSAETNGNENTSKRSHASHMQALEGFYLENYKKRSQLIAQFEMQYGEQQRETSRQMAELLRREERSKGIYGFWRTITGAARKDKETYAMLDTTLANINERKREALDKFEYDRMQRLEGLKAEYSPIYKQEAKNDFDRVSDDIDQDELTAFLEQQEARKEMAREQFRGLDRS